jgi:hypothetical protein
VMTLDPRVFVLDNAAGVEAISEALGQAYTVAEDSAADGGATGTGARRRSWLDTFDWRLFEAGLVLEHEQTRRGGSLILTGLDSAPLAEQPVTFPTGRWRIGSDP